MTPDSSSPPAPAPASKGFPRWAQIGCGALVVAGLACGGLFAYINNQITQQREAYEAGHAAYEKGDCKTAADHFTKALSFSGIEEVELKINKDRLECEAFQKAANLHEANDHAGAVLSYADFVDQRIGSSLTPFAKQNSSAIFDTVAPKEVANLEVCTKLDDLVTGRFIPKNDKVTPEMYFSCGGVFEEAQQFTDAVIIYDRFRKEYANHAMADDVKNALARASIAEAEQVGAGNIPAPQSTGQGSGSGPAKVIIQNDSPERLSLVFSGPDVRVEELEPCTECENYVGSGPEFCPEKGPIGEYELPAGDYSVVVKSISDSGVTPFSGSWSLAKGDEYYQCFFLVTREP